MFARHKFYRQCELEQRIHGESIKRTTCYLPSEVVEEAVTQGKFVRFRDKASEPWSEGWVVLHMGPRRPGKQVEANSREWAHHREATNI